MKSHSELKIGEQGKNPYINMYEFKVAIFFPSATRLFFKKIDDPVPKETEALQTRMWRSVV